MQNFQTVLRHGGREEWSIWLGDDDYDDVDNFTR